MNQRSKETLKDGKKILFTWLSIILFVALLFMVYNDMEHDKDKVTEWPAATSMDLHPLVEEKKITLLDMASQKDIEVVVTDEHRSFESQDKLYAQGRSNDGSIVTYAKAGESYHNYGLAFDFALRNEQGEIIWDIHYDGNNNGKSDWFEVADLAKELGLEWGGDWNNKDYPHLQLTFGYSIEQLQNGALP